MKIAELVQAAQAWDLVHRPIEAPWRRVSDSQVARLLTGARLAIEAEQRQGHPVKDE